MKPNWLFLVIMLMYVSGFFAHALILEKTVYGDGIYYYSWLRSVAKDHDISFQNEYEYFNVTQPITPTGMSGNKYAIGPALLWLPSYFIVDNIFRQTGYELPYQLTVGATSVLYAIVGLLLLYRLLTKFFSPTIAGLTICAIAFATHLYFYGSLDTVNSHALSFFAATTFLSFLFTTKKNWLAIGIALALLGLIRLQDILLGLLLVPYWKYINWRHFIIGFAILFLPQLLAWQLLYGNFWTSPYISGGEGFSLLSPNILGVLFSLQNGLILWTPLTLVGIYGLFFLPSKLPKRWIVAIFALQIYVVASWVIWWQGASYSARMLISSLPLVALGIAQVFTWLRKYHWAPKQFFTTVIIPLSFINFLLMAYFLYRM